MIARQNLVVDTNHLWFPEIFRMTSAMSELHYHAEVGFRCHHWAIARY